MKQIPFDKYGLITEQDGNGGDSANRMGLWLWLHVMLCNLMMREQACNIQMQEAADHFRKHAGHLEPHPLVFIRHPDKSPDAGGKDVRDFANWNDWNNFSRDQWLPLVTAWGFIDHDKFNRIFKTTCKRHGTMANGDILGPGHWGHLWRINKLRNKPSALVWVGLWLADLANTISFLIGSFKRGTSDTLVGFMLLLTAYTLHPTWISRFNLWFVRKFSRYPRRWAIYFGHDNGAQLHTLAEPLFKKYL